MPVRTPDQYEYDPATDGGGTYIYDGSTSGSKSCKLIVSYNVNGAEGDPPSASSRSYYGEYKLVTLSVKVASKTESMYKSGYAFIGWSTSSSATRSSYNPGKTISKQWTKTESGTTSYTLYAVWTNKDIFIYRPDENCEEYPYEQYAEKPLNQATTLAGAIFTRTGYTLTGWKLENGTHIGNVNQSYTATSSEALILYPEWTANTYTLTFRPVTGVAPSGQILTMTATYDAEITIPGQEAYIKENYYIDSWNEDRWGQASAWYPGQTYTFKRTEDITLYAIWRGDKYYVVYDDDNQNTLTIPELLELPDTVYEVAEYGQPFYTKHRPQYKDYYTFAGWETSSNELLTKSDYCMDSYIFGSDPTWTRTSSVIVHPVWSNSYPFGKLFYGRRDSSDYGIIVEQPPDYYWPEKDYTLKDVKGKNGEVLIDSGRYKNVEKKYKIAVHSNDGFVPASRNLVDFLHRYDGYPDYMRLEDTYEPDVFMLGVYKEKNDLTNILDQAGRAEITFDCKPQKYLLSGQSEVEIVNDDTSITNPTEYPALPIIKVRGTGLIKFYMRPTRSYLGQSGSKLITSYFYVNSNFNEVILDCETFTITDINGKNMNPYVSLSRRIELYPGATGIKYEGDIEKLTIIPRWWRL